MSETAGGGVDAHLASLRGHALEIFRVLPVPAAVFVDGALQVASEPLIELVGATDESQLLGSFGDRVLTSDALARMRSRSEATRLGSELISEEIVLQTYTGLELTVRVEVQGIVLDGHAASVLVIHDRTHEVARTKELEARALVDTMTGLMRREVFLDELNRAVARSRRSGESLTLLFCDLDGLKAVNDTWGHPVGDEVIGATAGRILGATRPGDPIGRWGGDEFVVLCERVDGAAAHAVAARIVSSVNGPLAVHGNRITLSISVGGVTDRGTYGSKALIEFADAAMYRAKRSQNPIDLLEPDPPRH